MPPDSSCPIYLPSHHTLPPLPLSLCLALPSCCLAHLLSPLSSLLGSAAFVVRLVWLVVGFYMVGTPVAWKHPLPHLTPVAVLEGEQAWILLAPVLRSVLPLSCPGVSYSVPDIAPSSSPWLSSPLALAPLPFLQFVLHLPPGSLLLTICPYEKIPSMTCRLNTWTPVGLPMHSLATELRGPHWSKHCAIPPSQVSQSLTGLPSAVGPLVGQAAAKENQHSIWLKQESLTWKSLSVSQSEHCNCCCQVTGHLSKMGNSSGRSNVCRKIGPVFDKRVQLPPLLHKGRWSLRFSTGKAISWIQFIANTLLLCQNHNRKSRSLRTGLIVRVSPLTECLSLLSGLHVSVSVTVITIVCLNSESNIIMLSWVSHC